MNRGITTKALPVGMAAAVLLGLLVPTDARAHAEPATGGGVFSGTTELPVVPCPAPQPGSLPCEGSWRGTFTGGFSGVHTLPDGRRIPWAVEIDAPATAAFAYADTVEQGVCTGATARGRLDFVGGLNQAFGAYANSSLVPAPIVGTKAALHFEWQRTEAGGALLATSFSMDVDVYGVGWVAVVDDDTNVSVAEAVASFVPDAPLDCAGDPGPVTGVVTGRLSAMSVAAR